MDNNSRLESEPQKMMANRRVVETTCSICGAGFQMAEAVYQCPSCAGYHHTACWDAAGQCPQSNEAFRPSGATVDQSESVTVPFDGLGAATTPLAPDPTRPQPVPASLAPDERRCPNCREVIKQQALKCRFCGAVLHSDLAGRVPSNVASDIESRASDALKFSLIGIVCFGFILEPMALFNGIKALRLMGQYPEYVSAYSARAKAITGVTIGGIILTFYALALLGSFISD